MMLWISAGVLTANLPLRISLFSPRNLGVLSSHILFIIDESLASNIRDLWPSHPRWSPWRKTCRLLEIYSDLCCFLSRVWKIRDCHISLCSGISCRLSCLGGWWHGLVGKEAKIGLGFKIWGLGFEKKNLLFLLSNFLNWILIINVVEEQIILIIYYN